MIEIYTDGTITHNPGGQMRYAFSVSGIYEETGGVEDTVFNTNWVSEYTAVYKALKWCLDNNKQNEAIVIKSDLETLVNTMNVGSYKSKHDWKTFYPVRDEIIKLKPLFKDLTFVWIPRLTNKADRLMRV